MKTKESQNTVSVLEQLRQIRDKISKELKGMTAEQVVEHLKSKKTLHPESVWKKQD